MRSSRRQLKVAAVVGVIGVAVVAVGMAAVMLMLRPGNSGGDQRAADVPVPNPSPEPHEWATGGIVDTPDESTLIATLSGDVPRYDAPGGEPGGVVPGTWHDRPSVLPVIDQAPGWLRVRLAQRPNGSTAWIRRSDVTLATTPYRIEIDVATTRARLFDAGELVLNAPAGVGVDEAPTTIGNYFVTFFQEPPDDMSGWGPFVMVTSNHSETISDFQSSGDAIAAIHGPLGSEEAIGATGAKVSYGCVRLHLDDLAMLRNVPAGTPIDVIDSSAGSTDA